MSWFRRRRISWSPDDPLPPVSPEQLASQLMFKGGPPGRPAAPPADINAALAASLTQPAAVRYVMDFNADGYLIRGTMDRQPGPWPQPPPIGAVEVLTPPEGTSTPRSRARDCGG